MKRGDLRITDAKYERPTRTISVYILIALFQWKLSTVTYIICLNVGNACSYVF